MLLMPWFMSMDSFPLRSCSDDRCSLSSSISRMARSSDTLAFTTRMFSSVSWVLACSASSASCMRLWRRFMGSRKAIIMPEPSSAANMSTGMNRQSIAMSMTAAPTKDTPVRRNVGSMVITPFLTTLTSENTRFTSSPL